MNSNIVFSSIAQVAIQEFGASRTTYRQ